MKKLLLILAFSVLGIWIAYASSVTTIDGVNFAVTNDGGYTASMTNQQIMQKVIQFNSAMTADNQRYLSDQESFIIWDGVEQMAVNAQTNAIGTGTATSTGTSTGTGTGTGT